MINPRWLVLCTLLAGCAIPLHSAPKEPDGKYMEVHRMDITVIYTDQQTLEEVYERLGGSGLVKGLVGIRGFYHPALKRLYCRKGDFYHCGHELHHATGWGHE